MIVCKEISLVDDLPWDDLVEKSVTATFFQTKDWLSIWRKHFPVEHTITGVYEEGELIGIAPLVIGHSGDSERSVEDSKITYIVNDSGPDYVKTSTGRQARMTERVIEFLGVTAVLEGELVSDFGDIIAKTCYEKIIWKEVLEFSRRPLAKTARSPLIRMQFNFIREDSPSFEILKALGGEIEEVDVAPYLLLPESWEDYLISLDRHNRHELKRKMRKIENEEMQIVLSSGSLEDINELFRLMEISDVKKKSFLSEQMKDFFREVIITFYQHKNAELMFLRKDDVNIAATLSFQYHKEVLLYNSGFDPQFGYLSAGLVLKAHLIKRAIEQKKKRFDFLRGGERYKYDLGGKERKLYRIRC